MRRNRQVRDDRATRKPPRSSRRGSPRRPVQVTARAGEGGKLFGSVTAADIVAAVKDATGVELDRRKITLAEPLKALGPAEVPVQLHADVTVTVAVEVVAEIDGHSPEVSGADRRLRSAGALRRLGFAPFGGSAGDPRLVSHP